MPIAKHGAKLADCRGEWWRGGGGAAGGRAGAHSARRATPGAPDIIHSSAPQDGAGRGRTDGAGARPALELRAPCTSAPARFFRLRLGKEAEAQGGKQSYRSWKHLMLSERERKTARATPQTSAEART